MAIHLRQLEAHLRKLEADIDSAQQDLDLAKINYKRCVTETASIAYDEQDRKIKSDAFHTAKKMQAKFSAEVKECKDRIVSSSNQKKYIEQLIQRKKVADVEMDVAIKAKELAYSRYVGQFKCRCKQAYMMREEYICHGHELQYEIDHNKSRAINRMRDAERTLSTVNVEIVKVLA